MSGFCRAVGSLRGRLGSNLKSSACFVPGLSAVPSRTVTVRIQSKCAHRTRLETRTKESNMYASQWAH